MYAQSVKYKEIQKEDYGSEDTSCDDYSYQYGALSGSFEKKLCEYKHAKMVNDVRAMKILKEDLQFIYDQLVLIRQKHCHHEFFKSENKCCRCGVPKTGETMKIAKARRETGRRHGYYYHGG